MKTYNGYRRLREKGLCSDYFNYIDWERYYDTKLRGDEKTGNVILDPIELLGYKIFEKLGLGPRTTFIVNPYISNGLFIATESLTTNSATFFELGFPE